MVDAIQVLKSQETCAAGQPAPTASNWLSSHPSNEQRLQSLQSIRQIATG